MVVVCEPITVRLNTCPPPEHWSWYSVITPFCSVGISHVRENDKGSLDTPVRLLGGVPGPAKHRMQHQLYKV